MAKFDIKTEATKPLYAGVGVTDLAVELVRDYVTVAQKRVSGLDLEPKKLRTQISKDAKARRTAIEKRVSELQSDAKTLPSKVQAFVDDNMSTVGDAYGDLIGRGENLVTRIRKQESTKATGSSAKTTATKAKTTKTQASKATKATTSTAKSSAKSSAKKATTTAKKKSAPAQSSAKATTTAASNTAASATQAVADAAQKVGN